MAMPSKKTNKELQKKQSAEQLFSQYFTHGQSRVYGGNVIRKFSLYDHSRYDTKTCSSLTK